MRTDVFRQLAKRRETVNKQLTDHAKQIKKLINHRFTKLIDKESELYKKPMDFIEQNFPDEAEQVAGLSVYSTRGSSIKYCLNTSGAGGLFSMQTNDIFVSFDAPEYSELINILADPDEVLCHEMLHAVSRFRCGSNITRKDTTNEEDFAYGQMVPYMREKGMSDKEIARKALMGYCMSRHLAERDYFAELGYDRKKLNHRDATKAWFKVRRHFSNELKEGSFKAAMQFIEHFGHERAERFESRFSALEF